MARSLKEKSRSAVAVLPQNPVTVLQEESQPLDKLTVNIKSLRVMDEKPTRFVIKVTLCDQLIIGGVIMAIGKRDKDDDKTIVSGYMSYDPSDYEKINVMADQPLCVRIQPLKSNISISTGSKQNLAKSVKLDRSFEEISCCNVDILSVITEEDKVIVRKRMEPHIQPPILLCKSWENLPLVTMELVATRDVLNNAHHKVIKNANFMKITLVAAYNMLMDFNDEFTYIAASRMPKNYGTRTVVMSEESGKVMKNQQLEQEILSNINNIINFINSNNFSLTTFNQGYQAPERFDGLKFKPKWESLRVGDEYFTKADDKYECAIEDLQNDDNIPLERYMKSTQNATVWGSFHRNLMLDTSDQYLWKYIRRNQWPLEVHIYGEKYGYSFMAFMNLFKLLYPGENVIRLVVPLQWINADAMMEKCNCDLLLTPNDKAPSMSAQTAKNFASKTVSESAATYASADAGSLIRPTGADENSAFVVIEVKFARPLKNIVMPPVIPKCDINGMLAEMEKAEPHQRHCFGRGQLERDWQSTVRSAAAALRRVPYYSMTEFCAINRQLSETRTRVEVSTSCWQDAAIYVNNNFVVQDFLEPDEAFEELLMMAHACLTMTACATLVGVDKYSNVDPLLKAARHARQLQDYPHAMELHLQRVIENPRDENSWRELSTCLKDIDRDWATVCLNKAVMLNPRHPLTLISKGCMVIEEDPAAAEPFFVALLALYPFWSPAWVIASVYYMDRELFHMAEQVMVYNKKLYKEGMMEELNFPRAWEHELGDWWDSTPLLPGMSPYFVAADLLLRLRAINLADVCVSRALCETGDSAAYYHLLALCCRLRGKVEDALCHLRIAIDKYGEVNYLRSLEGECLHQLKDVTAAATAFEKAGSCVGAYSLLLSNSCRNEERARTILVDLTRRQPNAYAWMALADDWMMRSLKKGVEVAPGNQYAAETCASVCAIQALKLDRRAGRAWALLAKLVKPSARRLYCMEMARWCGYEIETTANLRESGEDSEQSLCHHLSKTLKECRCQLCENIQF